MSLREAAQQALEAYDAHEPLAVVMEDLRTALAEPKKHEDWCASLTQMLTSLPPKPAPCNCKRTEPVAWGMPSSDGAIYDVITPEEHARVEGAYTVPLYTQDDTALLRQALEALETRAVNDYFVEHIYAAITALRERLGEKA